MPNQPSTGKQQARKLDLSDDGELPDLDTLMDQANTPAAEPEVKPLYCTDCGSANIATATYCRNCGSALALQQLKHTPSAMGSRSPKMVKKQPVIAQDEPRTKRKNDQMIEMERGPQSERLHNAVMFLRLWSVLGVTALSINALVFKEPWAIIPIMIAWFLVEAVRKDKSAIRSWPDFWAEFGTVALWIAVGVNALVFGFSWVIIPLCIGWFLVESVRS